MSDQIIYEVQAKPINPLNRLNVKVTRRHLIFERGTLRTEVQQIPMAHVYDVDSKQSMTQKARSLGTVFVHVTRPGTQTETVELVDIPMPEELVRYLNDVSLQARRDEAQIQNTYYGAGQPQWGVPHQPTPEPVRAQEPTAPSAEAIIGQIKQLGELRDAGILSEQEFEAKKAEMLARL